MITLGYIPDVKIKKPLKRRAYICGDCEKHFYFGNDIDDRICDICGDIICFECTTKHCFFGSMKCVRAFYDYRYHSIEKLKNWPYPKMQLYCCFCMKLYITDIIIHHGAYICTLCIPSRNKIIGLCKYHMDDREVDYEYFGVTDKGETLFTQVPHVKTCKDCKFSFCKCSPHDCISKTTTKGFHPHIAFAFKERLRNKVFLIYLIHKKYLRELPKDILISKIIERVY